MQNLLSTPFTVLLFAALITSTYSAPTPTKPGGHDLAKLGPIKINPTFCNFDVDLTIPRITVIPKPDFGPIDPGPKIPGPEIAGPLGKRAPEPAPWFFDFDDIVDDFRGPFTDEEIERIRKILERYIPKIPKPLPSSTRLWIPKITLFPKPPVIPPRDPGPLIPEPGMFEGLGKREAMPEPEPEAEPGFDLKDTHIPIDPDLFKTRILPPIPRITLVPKPDPFPLDPGPLVPGTIVGFGKRDAEPEPEPKPDADVGLAAGFDIKIPAFAICTTQRCRDNAPPPGPDPEPVQPPATPAKPPTQSGGAAPKPTPKPKPKKCPVIGPTKSGRENLPGPDDCE